ncbi:MAG: hypothetical protein J0L73_06870 [Verrucomicrobia bacterium]|nr:hypothetical protein [Verrucomicrobiota bacterium]
MKFSKATLPFADAFRYSKQTRQLAGWLALIRGRLSSGEVIRSLHLARAMAYADANDLRSSVLEALRKTPGFDKSQVWRDVMHLLPRFHELVLKDPSISRSIVLKAPGESGEKGVLLMTFEYNWVRLLLTLSEEETRWLNENYDIVLSTSWSPTDYAALALAVSSLRGTVFVQSCNYDEIAKIEAFHPRLKCLETLPCDWINPRLYAPKPPEERQTDILMVANWGEFKRHWDLFRALSKMPPKLKVVLIGQREPGRSRDDIHRLATTFGVTQQLVILESLPIAEVARHQCDAKVSVIMSRREGCCVAAVESLFAGCALAMREDAHVGPLAYINDQTGRRLRPNHLHEDLSALLEQSSNLRPHHWAAAHLSCELSRAKLNSLLKAEAEKTCRPWTCDIAQPQWHPHPTFATENEREALRPAYTQLRQRFPKVFSEALIMESWR